MAPRERAATTAGLPVNSSSTGTTWHRSPPLLTRVLRPGVASRPAMLMTATEAVYKFFSLMNHLGLLGLH
jgi:hypothetical protein